MADEEFCCKTDFVAVNISVICEQIILTVVVKERGPALHNRTGDVYVGI